MDGDLFLKEDVCPNGNLYFVHDSLKKKKRLNFKRDIRGIMGSVPQHTTN